MAATYRIVENHDGCISADSEVTENPVIRILPTASNVKIKATGEQKDKPDRGAETILLIEDEALVMEVNRAILEKLGYRVLGAESGAEAAHFAETFDGDINLAILDIVLPDMCGKDIYPLLMQARPDLKVIVSSGYTVNGPAQDILDAGGQRFIQKPFSMETLALVLKEVLEEK